VEVAMIEDASIRQIFLYVDDKYPGGQYADGVNVIDFGRKIDAYSRHQERLRLIELVRPISAEAAQKIASLAS
jgi:hypothetical protein